MINSLKSIRFYLAVTIFLNHLVMLKYTELGDKIFEEVFHNGNYGVIFFLVLSGFGIAIGYGDYFVELTKDKWRTFVVRRIKKLYPMYIFSMSVVFLYQVVQKSLVFDLKELLKIFLCIVMGQTLVPGWYSSFNGAAWYVSCIFFLYLITPIILHLLSSFRADIKKLVIFGGGGICNLFFGHSYNRKNLGF